MDTDCAPATDNLVDRGFLSAAHNYKQALAVAASPGEFRRLWRDTSLPYRMHGGDPHSDAYRDEVRAVYQGLTRLDYDVGAELTSTKQDDDQFQIGYPWTSGDLGVIAAEMSKSVQALRALHQEGATGSVIEFGAGWGNLALPLARAGLAVTTVDIDEGFNRRLRRLASEQLTRLTTFGGTFMDAVEQIPDRFDTVIFQSSFHHCLDFDALLAGVLSNLLKENGRILFLSEPIIRGLNFPWGIRYDGEALWAVMCNGWLELGFEEDFFLELLFRHGLLASRVAGVPGLVGDGWCATRAGRALSFGKLVLPSAFDAGFYPPEGEGVLGRFCRGAARLPAHGMDTCRLTVQNFSPAELSAGFRSADSRRITLAPGERRQVEIRLTGEMIEIDSETFCPNEVMGNGDTRLLGLAVIEATWSRRS